MQKWDLLRKFPTLFLHLQLLRIISGKCCLLLIATSLSSLDPKNTFKRVPGWKHIFWRKLLLPWGPRERLGCRTNEGSSVGHRPRFYPSRELWSHDCNGGRASWYLWCELTSVKRIFITLALQIWDKLTKEKWHKFTLEVRNKSRIWSNIVITVCWCYF
jgi:hypothetical protein